MRTIPNFGRVTAEPHEFLILIRDGKVKRSGQGVSVFKWPSDSVTLIPTTIQKLQFRADQVTLEKAGVEVTGLAVYRIVEPLLAYRMIDRDHHGLTDILREMFVGATRRIVAGLRLEECLTHRKERVAAALMAEIAPVLAGEGSLQDGTSTGWGVVIDTIEIQDVKVLSQEVFTRLQAPYREKLALDALRAKEEVAVEENRLAFERKRAAEDARRAIMAEEEARITAERKREMEALEHKQALARRAHEEELLRARERAEAEQAEARIALSTRRAAAELEAEIEAKKRSVPELGEARLQEIMLTETLPSIANAFRASFDRVNVTTTDGSLFSFLSAGLDQVMDVARARGVVLPGLVTGDEAKKD
ncbi:SPFH domain-containing protein [Polyangium sorediatum]|uniref:SPFH domain-containing protein n=1 Tax=Polyangium sorediatum TaxID=889274 RepID=A0ABT6P3V3_9BACT|nr:SPFH domain-containing protein [Polyangium sorediatum]MDI1435285.1 SPFH domain-containing protein [Polyangium sorediatum]